MTTHRPGPPVTVGIIGAGRMGSFHAETLARRLPGTRLAAVTDPAPGAAQRLADRLGCPRALTDPGQMLADPAIDAVVIATPARTHAGLVEAAARAGKAVYCEKPMALTLADANRAIAAACRAGIALQVGFNRRYDAGSAPLTTRSPPAPSARPNCCAHSPATPSWPTRLPSRPGRSSSRLSSMTSTRCASSTPAPSRSRYSPWPMR